MLMNLQLVNAIRTLSSSASVRKSKVKRIRELLPEINRAQQVGICLSDIAMTLKESGFEGMNLKCLQNLMYQARKGEKLVSDNSPKFLLVREVATTSTFAGFCAAGVFDLEQLEGIRPNQATIAVVNSFVIHIVNR